MYWQIHNHHQPDWIQYNFNQRRRQVETTLYQHCTNVVQRCFDVVSTLFQRRAPTLYQRCVTLKCWLGSMVLILCLLLCNHDNLILKLHQKKNSYFDKAWIFIGSFKVESVQEMINKEVLAQFIYKTAPTSKLFIQKNFEKLFRYEY